MKKIIVLLFIFLVHSFNAFSLQQNLHIEVDLDDPYEFGYLVSSNHANVTSTQGLKIDSSLFLERYVTFAGEKIIDEESQKISYSPSDEIPRLEFVISNDILNSPNMFYAAYSAYSGEHKKISIQPLPFSRESERKRPSKRSYICEVHVDHSIGPREVQVIKLSTCTDQARSE